jgi:phosphoribosyl-ATP pyrophosphohydrolase/phosphoribosyl-AMP cyclohydrolase
VTVYKDGPACHLGTDSCFNEVVFEGEDEAFSLDALMKVIEGRKLEKKEGSYTTYLFEKGIDKILKKVGEECTEVIIAGKANDKAETIYEIADLVYHVMVLMIEMGISLEDIKKELASRHVIDHKVKQEKMTK